MSRRSYYVRTSYARRGEVHGPAATNGAFSFAFGGSAEGAVSPIFTPPARW